MAKFCTKCGKELVEGEIHNCPNSFAAPQARPNPIPNQNPNPAQRPAVNPNPAPRQANNPYPPTGGNTTPRPAQNNTGSKKLWEKIKNSAGIGDPESNKTDAFEKGRRIIPDCVRPNDSEIPVKQYEIATLRNRLAFITYAKAIGRIQVTNKRVIFRAPGRSIVGRTTLQHEFAIDEIAGFETRREYLFNLWDMLASFILTSLGAGISAGIQLALMENDSIAFSIILGILFGLVGPFLFFKIKKRWGLKLFTLGFSGAGAIVGAIGGFDEGGFAAVIGALLFVTGLVSAILVAITTFLNSFKPNLALLIKTKAATPAIDIVRKKRAIPFLGAGTSEAENHTGYYEILPLDNAEKSIRELGALINDIQKLGDFGIEKWKAQ